MRPAEIHYGKHVHEALPCQRSLNCNRRWDSSIWGIPQFEGFASLKSCAAPQKHVELSRFFCTSELNGTGRPTLTVLSYLLNSIQIKNMICKKNHHSLSGHMQLIQNKTLGTSPLVLEGCLSEPASPSAMQGAPSHHLLQTHKTSVIIKVAYI